MGETEDGMSRQDRIREPYGRSVGDHDYSPRNIKDYHSIKGSSSRYPRRGARCHAGGGLRRARLIGRASPASWEWRSMCWSRLMRRGT